MTVALEYDVVVVGSGAGGLVAAIRAHDLGLTSAVVEKSDMYGGTSAVSGGAIWIPNNDDIAGKDTPQMALEYLMAVTEGQVPKVKLERYVDVSPTIPRYLKSLGVEYYSHPVMSYPDYYPDAPGAVSSGRNMFVRPMDGTKLSNEFFRLRESYPEFKLFGRIALDLEEGGVIGGRYPGWKRAVARVLARYYGDISWRRKTRRDRLLTVGNALIGGLRVAMMERNIPLFLNTRMTKLESEGGKVTGIVSSREGEEVRIKASKGVVLASGGYEQSQEMREKNYEQPGQTRWSATPRDNNTGDGLRAAQAIGADTEFLKEAWWAPTIAMPSIDAPNTVRHVAIFYERGFPHCLAVNRLGNRFTNEICSYHQFGQAMIRDAAETGANNPCWLIFDSVFRAKYPLGGLLPADIQPDSKVPRHWFDSFLYRADSVEELAAKIGVPANPLSATVSRFNGFARKGVDEDFSKGGNFYNRFFGDHRHSPSAQLGTVERAPFYAVALYLGDIGSKGGPKTDEDARVLDVSGKPIPGLFAIGNASGSVMGSAYPGAGATLGSAMTFGYVAATRMAGANEW
ncbi:MAG: FAD-binding protein [Sphingomonadaceae bacterium]